MEPLHDFGMSFFQLGETSEDYLARKVVNDFLKNPGLD